MIFKTVATNNHLFNNEPELNPSLPDPGDDHPHEGGGDVDTYDYPSGRGEVQTPVGGGGLSEEAYEPADAGCQRPHSVSVSYTTTSYNPFITTTTLPTSWWTNTSL